ARLAAALAGPAAPRRPARRALRTGEEMSWNAILPWVGPLLDVIVLGALAAIGWRLRRDPSVAWQACEAKLREAQEGLKLLVLQAEGEARELDRRLAAHAAQIEAASEGLAPGIGPANVPRRPTSAAGGASGPSLAE